MDRSMISVRVISPPVAWITAMIRSCISSESRTLVGSDLVALEFEIIPDPPTPGMMGRRRRREKARAFRECSR